MEVASQSKLHATHSLLEEIRHGADRIVEIVRVQNVDVHEELDNTPVMLRNKLKGGITVQRDYAPELPRILAHGCELNQAWTNTIDNAGKDALNRAPDHSDRWGADPHPRQSQLVTYTYRPPSDDSLNFRCLASGRTGSRERSRGR